MGVTKFQVGAYFELPRLSGLPIRKKTSQKKTVYFLAIFLFVGYEMSRSRGKTPMKGKHMKNHSFVRQSITAFVCAASLVAFTRASWGAIIPYNPANDLASSANGGVGYSSSVAFGGTPDRLVDGNVDGNYGDSSVAHSGSTGAGNFMGVTLSGVQGLREIILWNRTDCCDFRIDGGGSTPFTLELFNGVPLTFSGFYTFTPSIFLSDIDGHTASGMVIPLPGVAANNIKVTQNYADFMNLAEIQAFGIPEPSSLFLICIGGIALFLVVRRGSAGMGKKLAVTASVVAITGLAANVASAAVIVWQPADDLASATHGGVGYASSTAFGGTPDRLVDGNVDGNYFGDNSVAHSASGDPGNFMGVTLTGGPLTLDKVIVWNRTDCCGDRIDGSGTVPFTLELFNGGPLVFSGTYTFSSDIFLTDIDGHAASGRVIQLPGVLANDIRITQNNANLMNLAEIQAFGVPEPSSLMLLGLGIAGVIAGYRRMKK